MQKKRSFENELINLFWGLTKGSRLLNPYSFEFKKLKFKIVGFELLFHFSEDNRKATPDMVLESVRLRESIIVEWTQEKRISQKKINQIKKYVKIDEDTLRAYVSENCTENKDVVLIATPEGESDFVRFITSKNLPVILLIYHYPYRYLLKKKLNKFSVNETENFFARTLIFERIPYSFPDINLSNLSHSLLVDKVISTLIKILVKENEGFEFNIEYFTREMLTPSFYNLLHVNKRTEIAKAAKEIINRLIKEKYCEGILKRVKSDPPTWQIILPKTKKEQKIKGIKRNFEKFINKLTGKPYQQGLFEAGGGL
jgi:hypothetical protein